MGKLEKEIGRLRIGSAMAAIVGTTQQAESSGWTTTINNAECTFLVILVAFEQVVISGLSLLDFQLENGLLSVKIDQRPHRSNRRQSERPPML